MNSLISIVVPVYKVEKYLDECVQSLVDQTYKNLEIILVDDGSPDRCPQMCDEWVQKDSRIRVIHKPNGGLSSARNAGLKNASGEYVYFLDSDDYIICECIEKMVRVIEQDPSTQMVLGSIMPEPKEESALRYYDLNYRNLPDKYTDNDSIRKKFYDVSTSIPVNGVNKLIKRTFLLENKLYFKEGIIHEDEHWAYFLYRKLERVAFLKEFTYVHPVNPNSIMNSSSKRRSADSLALVFDDFLDNIDENYFDDQYNYCFERFFPWYLGFYKLNSYHQLFRKFVSLAIQKWQMRFFLKLWLARISRNRFLYAIYSKVKGFKNYVSS